MIGLALPQRLCAGKFGLEFCEERSLPQLFHHDKVDIVFECLEICVSLAFSRKPLDVTIVRILAALQAEPIPSSPASEIEHRRRASGRLHAKERDRRRGRCRQQNAYGLGQRIERRAHVVVNRQTRCFQKLLADEPRSGHGAGHS